MFKKIAFFSLIIFYLVLSFLLYYKAKHISATFNDNKNFNFIYDENQICYFDDVEMDPLRKNLIINNINKRNINSIEVQTYAKKADKIKYLISDTEIIEKGNAIEIPIKYLVADKKSIIDVIITLTNDKKIHLKQNITVQITNNSNVRFSDSLPKIKVNKNIIKNDNYLYYCFMAIVVKDIDEVFIPLCIDSEGNIRSLFVREDIIPREIYNDFNKIEFLKLKFTYIDNNKIAFIGTLLKDNYISDIILIYNLDTKEIEKSIDLKNILDKNRLILNTKKETQDWLHPNSIFYDKKDNSLVISARYQGIIKIDLQGNLKWILSPHKNWSHKYTKYLLQAVNLDNKILPKKVQEGEENYITEKYTFEWCWGQHFASILTNGDIIVFDNGHYRNFIEHHNLENPNYSRAVIYRIDEKNKTIKQVWQYGKELYLDFFSIAKSSVIPIQEEECLICSGLIINRDEKKSYGKIIRINFKTNEIIFDIDVLYQNKHLDTKRKNSYFDEIIYTLLVDIKK